MLMLMYQSYMAAVPDFPEAPETRKPRTRIVNVIMLMVQGTVVPNKGKYIPDPIAPKQWIDPKTIPSNIHRLSPSK